MVARAPALRVTLLVLTLITLLGGCTSDPSSPAAAAPSASPPQGSLPASSAGPGPASAAQQRAAVAAARRFTRRLLTYSHLSPAELAPSVRLRGLITHRYAAALAPRDRVDPALATTLREVSATRITSARTAADAPGDAGTQYVLLTCIQTLTADGRTDRIEMVWSLRLLRYGETWRVDEVSQAG
ncbi:hypothetical protein [Planomonospora parontospora]|uniref:hypothetical protein n=1 Tax=Planomonospora parontospora TaxID=58119 RepID=UPI0016715A15|nr:hypothetical protein [Planomonospora parontospora]GGL49901.1 hypothetical protein GCM10014719_58920 [Planomonospora parontospora subsp. antibiotica]GII19328.1 hypothetical protein Ppa05_60540 [Planomonospora parontospora subsp. antibiotica]